MTNQTFPTGFSALTPATTITLLGDDGTQNGTITVAQILALVPAPGVSLTYIGPWAANTAYAVGNVITNAGSSYVVTTAFTSAATFSTANLGLIAQAGEDGVGAPGESAYQVAQASGFTGTQQEWLASLTGAAGVGVSSFSATQSTVTAGQPSTVTVTATMTDGTTEEYTYEAPPGANGSPGGSSGGAASLTQGTLVQPTGIVSSDDLTVDMAAATYPATAPLVAQPGSEIIIDPTVRYQEFIGVGGAFTSATAYCLMNYMTAAARTAFLQKMFGQDGFNCLRICFGSSDYEATGAYYSYADNGGTADPTLATFSLGRDYQYLIPLLQEIVSINPRIWITAGIWSPPGWMKTSGSVVNGDFNATAANYTTLANYCVMAIQGYQACGIPISAITFNEPQGDNNGYPCCGFTDAQLTTLYGSYLGPSLDAAFLTTKIIATDTSWGSILTGGYGYGALANATASQYTNALGFHGYNGEVSQMTKITRQYPNAEIYFTEWISAFSESNWFRCEKTSADLMNNMLRAGAKALLWWNIMLDQNGMPYELATSGSHICRGMVTVNNSTGALTYNSDYVLFAHLSKYVKPGAYRIKSNTFTLAASYDFTYNQSAPASGTDVTNVAFQNPDGSIVVYMWNPLTTTRTVTLTDMITRQSFPVTIPAQSAMTATYGASSIVSTAGMLTAPASPTLGTPTNNSSGQIVLTITAPSSNGSTDLGGYQIFSGASAGGEATWPVATLPPTATTWTDITTAPGASAFYIAKAFGGGGTSPASGEVTGMAQVAVPGSPGVSLNAGAAQVTVTVTAPSNTGGATITGYPIYAGATSGRANQTLVTTLSAAGSYVISGLANGTAEYVNVGATNSAGTTYAAEQSATPIAAGTLPAHYLVTGGGSGATAYANDSVSFSSGFLDARVWTNMSSYTPSANYTVFGDYTYGANNTTTQAWGLVVATGGNIGLITYDSTTNTPRSVYSLTSSGANATVTAAPTTGLWLRAVLNASGATIATADSISVPANTCQFYTSVDGTTWTMLGVAQSYTSGVGIKSVASGKAYPSIGSLTNTGEVYKATLYNGPSSIAYAPDFTAQATGATSFTDGENITWTIATGASIA